MDKKIHYGDLLLISLRKALNWEPHEMYMFLSSGEIVAQLYTGVVAICSAICKDASKEKREQVRVFLNTYGGGLEQGMDYLISKEGESWLNKMINDLDTIIDK